MKRLSERQKSRLLLRQIWEESKRKKQSTNKDSGSTPSKTNALHASRYNQPLFKIKIPITLNLDGDRVELFRLLDKVRGTLVYKHNCRVFLDFSDLVNISCEAALMLLAEIDRSLALSAGKTLTGNHPKNQTAAAVLKDMGYFKFFKVPDPPISKTNRIFLEACCGDVTDGEVANRLIEIFEKQLRFAPGFRRCLYEALVECMDNVKQHAYPRDAFKGGRIVDRWWMMGFADNQTGEVTFSFVDQGVGIPRTLQKKWKQIINSAGLIFSESDLICEAIDNNRSRLQSVRRGNGLSVLRSLIEHAPEGRFRICSRRANVHFFRHDTEPQLFDSEVTYDGTLVSWSLSPQKVSKALS